MPFCKTTMTSLTCTHVVMCLSLIAFTNIFLISKKGKVFWIRSFYSGYKVAHDPVQNNKLDIVFCIFLNNFIHDT